MTLICCKTQLCMGAECFMASLFLFQHLRGAYICCGKARSPSYLMSCPCANRTGTVCTASSCRAWAHLQWSNYSCTAQMKSDPASAMPPIQLPPGFPSWPSTGGGAGGQLNGMENGQHGAHGGSLPNGGQIAGTSTVSNVSLMSIVPLCSAL